VVFLDSRASRTIQTADLLSYALWRYYSDVHEERFVRNFWPHFDHHEGQMHDAIHVTPKFARRECGCPLCLSGVAPTDA
jgi:hypothetical protein